MNVTSPVGVVAAPVVALGLNAPVTSREGGEERNRGPIRLEILLLSSMLQRQGAGRGRVAR